LPLVFTTLVPSQTRFEPALPAATLELARQQYGADGYQRMQNLAALIDEGRSESDWDRLHLVNDYVNRQITFVSDQQHYGRPDYWATPVESLGAGAGDCEDYAIAKYYALRAMGVPDEKLRLMYVRALRQNEPHMVLVYFEQPDQYPLVLDNLQPQIRSAIERNDLKPVYSFNASGLWLAKAGGLGNKVENSKGSSQWRAVLQKIERGQ
jgi:predicted transglutaminase-like cysteine proteinase